MSEGGSPIEQRAQLLLGALRTKPGHWFKRAELAAAIGNKTLGGGDRVIIQMLIERGDIEARAVETNAPSKQRFEYRVIK